MEGKKDVLKKGDEIQIDGISYTVSTFKKDENKEGLVEIEGQDSKGLQFKYNGEFKDGKINGKGELKFSNNFSFKGEFKNNKPNGYMETYFFHMLQISGYYVDGNFVFRIQGEIKNIYINGIKKDISKFEIKKVEADVYGFLNPIVSIKTNDGFEYKGEFKGGKINGKGELKTQNGEKYEGEFVNGFDVNKLQENVKEVELAGGKHAISNIYYNKNDNSLVFKTKDDIEYKGIFFSEDGTLNGLCQIEDKKNNYNYSGSILNGKSHGKGYSFTPFGSYYSGNFENGLFHGEGKLTNTSGTYTGKFVNGSIDEGMHDNVFFTYKGKFKNGLYEGDNGEMINKITGENYYGSFEKGKFQGNGTLTNNSGKYDGEFNNGSLNGQGSYESSDEKKFYRGEFKDGNPTTGVLFVRNDEKVEKTFKNKDKTFNRTTFTKKTGEFDENFNLIKGITEENCNAKEVINNGFVTPLVPVNEKNKPVRKIHNNKTEQHIYVDLTDVLFKSFGKITDDEKYHPIRKITTKENIQYYNSYFDDGKKNYSRGNQNISEHTKISYINHGYEHDRHTQEPIDEKSLNYCKEDTKSFYISSMSCHGGFYDVKGNNLFDIVKKQIEKSKQNCIGFVSLTKQQYPNLLNNVVSENLEIGIRRVPRPSDWFEKIFEEKYDKNEMVEYYCIKNELDPNTKEIKQKIYQIPAELCYWREDLIDNNLFDEAFEALKSGKDFKFKTAVMLNDGKSTIKENYEVVLKGQIKEVEVRKTNKTFYGNQYEIKEVDNEKTDLSLKSKKNEKGII